MNIPAANCIYIKLGNLTATHPDFCDLLSSRPQNTSYNVSGQWISLGPREFRVAL